MKQTLHAKITYDDCVYEATKGEDAFVTVTVDGEYVGTGLWCDGHIADCSDLAQGRAENEAIYALLDEALQKQEEAAAPDNPR